MRNLIKRAVIATGAAVVLLDPAVGVASASAAAPVLSWSQGGTTITAYDFGTVDAVGGQTASQTFTLTNAGGRASGTITVGLTGSSAFTITSYGCTGRSLGPKMSCGVTVEYAPTANSESDSATLTANGEHVSASLTLTGKGGTPDLTLSPGTLHCTSACIYDYDFGLVSAGSSKTTTFTVNSGTGTSETLSLLPANHPQFVTNNDKCSGQALAPSGTCTFDMTYTSPTGCSADGFLNDPLLVVGEPDFISYIAMVAHGECQ